ncbi:queuine tRNA-ribosyltransferase accessory subunit 2 [Sitodiplosis mosellana]|uniref:queuine tRNA-ribosyltransferase accessory subunit 2 n=1 Tax=Sitodiplosis mosellana TaxID=263140 RepID=UPI0024439032|nr:queuine tRNA-ribosyltransferase accessory subunit 2 [Sitodiplosis mosellana]
MKFIIDLVSKHSGRIGTLTKSDFELKTPLVLHYTKVGSVPHLSREVFDMITTEKQGLQVSLETTSIMEEALTFSQKGIAEFAGLDHTFSLVTLKDTGAITESFYSRNSVAILTRAGKISITPEKYMKLVETFKPDLFHTLCDGDTNESSGNKRIFNAVKRTESFFQTCASLYQTSASLAGSMLLAPIEGGYSIQNREATIKLLNAYENQEIIGGYFLDGFHSNGNSANQVDSNKVCDIIEKCNALLPTNKLKVMLGAYSPTLIIKLIQLGVDVFDTTYAYLMTSINQALTFNFDLDTNVEPDSHQFSIDLSDPIYKDQFEPYVKGCKCLACRNHTRAYTQHLVNTRELLAPILIMIHNTHHYLEFFKAIRQNIANDTLPSLSNLVSEQQAKYDLKRNEQMKKQNGAKEISCISTESNQSPFKKLKNAAND